MQKTFPMTLILVLSFSETAMANVPPAPQSGLALISILPLMIIMTLIGGGYKVLKGYYRELKETGRKPFLPRSSLVKIGGAILLLLFGIAIEGISVIVGFVFGCAAVGRGISLITWGIRSLPGRKRPAYLSGANPHRLITAGSILAVVALFLAGMPFGFAGYSSFFIVDAKADAVVRDLVAQQIAHAQIKGVEPDRISLFDQKERSWDISRFQRNFDIRLEPTQQEKGFTLSVIPVRFPLFPYNYLTARPSYLADQSGDIRRIYVHTAEPCSPEAPVVMKVDEKQVQEKLDKFRQ